MNIALGLQDFLVTRTKRSWEPEEDLFASGVVSSLFALELVVYLEKAYGVEVEGENLSIDNFRTIRRIEELVRELQAAAS
ncbi:acyl carrier protein [Umezawaea endophytica]|uniref:Acyl carrier protein n=1 Tax=Umezawaea endophytica TaxID=1654476 RepID=A0A9X2VHJ3_9PSEU|nr:acyl carrier protein [Umezawaea endophytica]MCS7476763.1 acyl carrier protein [Umezawaea endophytica]